MDHSLTHPIAATAIAAAVSTLPLVAAAAAITTAVAAIVSEIRQVLLKLDFRGRNENSQNALHSNTTRHNRC